MDIEKNVKIPTERVQGGGMPQKYPFDKMEVGDSFVATGKMGADLSGSLTYWSVKLGRKFKGTLHEADGTRVQKNGKDGLRVFRIK